MAGRNSFLNAMSKRRANSSFDWKPLASEPTTSGFAVHVPISFSPSFSRSQLGSSKMQYLHTTERDELVRESQQSDTLETENMIRADEKSTTRVCKCEVERDTALAEERSHRYASVRKAPQLTTGCSELAPSITQTRIPLHISFLSFPSSISYSVRMRGCLGQGPCGCSSRPKGGGAPRGARACAGRTGGPDGRVPGNALDAGERCIWHLVDGARRRAIRH